MDAIEDSYDGPHLTFPLTQQQVLKMQLETAAAAEAAPGLSAQRGRQRAKVLVLGLEVAAHRLNRIPLGDGVI